MQFERGERRLPFSQADRVIEQVLSTAATAATAAMIKPLSPLSIIGASLAGMKAMTTPRAISALAKRLASWFKPRYDMRLPSKKIAGRFGKRLTAERNR